MPEHVDDLVQLAVGAPTHVLDQAMLVVKCLCGLTPQEREIALAIVLRIHGAAKHDGSCAAEAIGYFVQQGVAA